MAATRLYTLVEARSLLPEVIPVLHRVREALLALRGLQAATSVASRGASGDGNLLADPWAGDPAQDRAGQLSRALQDGAAQLETWGIELKDPERGLIDFRHEREGRVVYLCYMLGESDIAHWHDIDTGFAGRQPL